MMSEFALTATETSDMRAIAGMIVPASAKHGVPGADDAVIFADIVRSVGRDLSEVRAALALASRLAGGAIADLDAAKLRAEGGNAVAVLTRIVLLCYYRDDRVMLSLGLEPRAPFPKGHVL